MPIRAIAGPLAAVLPLLLAAAPARSEPCTAIPSVQRSAQLDRNAADGGRLGRQIHAMTPPQGVQAVGTTMFAGPASWDAAWRAMTGFPGEVLCPAGSSSGTQHGKTLAIRVPAMLRNAADGSGRCVQAMPFTSATVTYVFEVAGPPESPSRILATAYPKP